MLDFYSIGYWGCVSLGLALSATLAIFGVAGWWQLIDVVFNGYNSLPYHIPRLRFKHGFPFHGGRLTYCGWCYRSLIFGITQVSPPEVKDDNASL